MNKEEFEKSLLKQFNSVIAKWEGGIVNDLEDPGGFTRGGIALNYNPDITKEQLLAMTHDDIANVLYKKYGEPYKIHTMSPGVALTFFDCSINQGPNAAQSLLQHAINQFNDYAAGPPKLVADGIFGTKSHAALQDIMANYGNKKSYRMLLTHLLALRMDRYGRKYNTYFHKGWSNRLMDIAFLSSVIELEWQAEPGHLDSWPTS